MDTIDGKLITEEQIVQWVSEAEEGFDVAAMLKKGRGRPGRAAMPSQVVAVRFTPQELEALDEMAAARHISRSEVIREKLFA